MIDYHPLAMGTLLLDVTAFRKSAIGYHLIITGALLGAFVVGVKWSVKGIKATPEELLSMSNMIGTKNPVVARGACYAGLAFCSVGAVSMAVLMAFAVYRDIYG
jgi:hypothetical protein